ncbi:putative phosphoglycerate mutase [Phytophthora cinnamomi]|uniref:putative phosphoglycerate mutase n=1 Tax=Phytophthora cinnamomi TaxID=4785 RepID=UPI003559665B|nr:putative phosphoglycerate mutase [Phytophthora cinnamomi]
MSLDLAVTPAPTPSPARGDGCSVKTEAVRIQELSLGGERTAGSRGSPKRKQRPPSGTVPTDLTSMSLELPADKRRGNKRALLQSGARRDGEAVEAEGLLVVAEQVDRAQTKTPPVFRTLGSIYCVLVRKPDGLFLETVAQDSHHSIVLDVDAMDLIHEPFKQNCKFQLRYRVADSSSGLRAPSYAFMASTKVERVEWVNAILRCQASAGGKDQNDCSPSRSDTGGGSTATGSARMQPGAADSSCRGDDQQEQARQDEICLQLAQPSLGEFVYSTPPIKHFILVRHGHYINAHVPQASDSEQVLSQMGRQQAEFAGKCLGMAHNRIPTRHDVTIYHSDMTRAVETAGIIANHFGEVSLNASPMLREGWPGTPYSTDFPVGGAAAAARNNSAFDTMQERSRVDVERMGKAFNWFFTDSGDAHEESDEESYCVLVCHANLIRFFLCRALGVDPANTWGHFEINHCGITRIDVCANRPLKVIAVNETGHLPQSLITSSEDHL